MTVIKQEDLIQSIADSLQHISYYHPLDYIQALGRAYELEESPAAKDAIAQILTNSRMCAEGKRPICQDTGIVTVFVKVGMDVRWDGATMGVTDMINEGVRRGYLNPDNVLRASIVSPPEGARKNTKDNTPAVIHYEIVPGDKVDVQVAAKGGGSENKSKFAMLNPSDSIVDWIIKTVPTMGAGWCPPGMLGIGIGGTAEKAMLMAKESLMDPIDIQDVIARGPQDWIEELRIELHEKVNALGDRRARSRRPRHRARRQDHGCAHARCDQADRDHPELRGHPSRTLHARWLGRRETRSAVARRMAESAVGPDTQKSQRVDLNTLTQAEVASWKPGQTLLLSGKMLTGRDAAHKRIADMLAKGEKLPVDFTNRVIYYVGPVDPVRDEAVGPAGPTTATRMDKFTEMMLSQTGLISMIGKAERGPVAIEAIKKHKAAYLMAVGGAAYLVSKAIRSARVLAFEDLGMEAIYEFDVQDMPVTVAVDSNGTSVHQTGPKEWQAKIGKIPVATV
jgi:fumarate hydratase class I